MSREVNVREFGALGNGIADDSPAVQKALDSGASVVKIPADNYRIVTTLKISSHTRIEADPAGSLPVVRHIPAASGQYDFLFSTV